jgi:hypothetical protein
MFASSLGLYVQHQAYDKLSPTFRKLIEGLQVRQYFLGLVVGLR